MKPFLKIQNIGPITEAELSINKVNIFIGPQSSGKSTIAKIISFCQWLEKDVLIHQGTDHIDQTYWIKNLHNYHKIGSYFNKNSFIEYSGDIVTFMFRSPDNVIINARNMEKENMRKITYIPSERNYVNIPNISSLPMGDDYIRDFIFDWLLIRNKYSKETPQDIINLGVKYHYDKNTGDVVTLQDGTPISLSEASSGLQAVIPLLVSLSYSTDWIYSHNQDLSFDKYRLFQKMTVISNDEIISRLGKPHYTFMIIEEPEENLFPVTQYELTKHIFHSLNSKADNSVVITTHSPYILTSINNLIQAGNIIEADVNKTLQVHQALGVNTSIRYKEVNAWALENGKLYSMNDNEYQLISATAIDNASEIINKDFETLLDL